MAADPAAASHPTCRTRLPRRRLRNQIALVSSASLLLAATSPSSLKAEEKGRYEEAATHGPLWTCILAPTIATITINKPAPASKPSPASLSETAQISFKPQPAVLEPLQSPKGPSEREVALLRLKLPSRYTSGSWAGVKTGYGQVFNGDRVGISRTGGAGFEQKDWIILKMVFKF